MRERQLFLLWVAFTALFLWVMWPHMQKAWNAMQVHPIQHLEPRPIHKEGKVVRWDKERTYGHYTLITERLQSSIRLIDMQGREVYRWLIPFEDLLADDPTRRGRKTTLYLYEAQVMPNGDVVAVALLFDITPYGYAVFKIDKHSRLVWKYSAPAHHDFSISKDNGNIYTLTHEFVYDRIPGLRRMYFPALLDSIEVISPDGKRLDKISIAEAFLGTRFKGLINQTGGGIARWDVMHANSVMRLDSDMAKSFPWLREGSLLVSLRSPSVIAIIDPDTRKVVWTKRRPFRAQHDARFLPNGNILVYNNLGRRTTQTVEYNPRSKKVKRIYPLHEKDYYRQNSLGRASRLPNGNTLVVLSHKRRLVEVAPDGEVVWKYREKPHRAFIAISKHVAYYNAIMSAQRYTKKDLPFLKGVKREPRASRVRNQPWRERAGRP